MRALYFLLLILGSTACGPSDVRCRRRPPPGADYGTCLAVIGAYYDSGKGACVTVSGCACDATCRDDVPFERLEDCQAVCTP
jgi:hypothetical protein